MELSLIDYKEISEQIKKWVLYIKDEYQINDYEYIFHFEIGEILYQSDPTKKIYLNVTSIPPKPTLEYKINIDIPDINNSLKEYLQKIVKETSIILM